MYICPCALFLVTRFVETEPRLYVFGSRNQRISRNIRAKTAALRRRVQVVVWRTKCAKPLDLPYVHLSVCAFFGDPFRRNGTPLVRFWQQEPKNQQKHKSQNGGAPPPSTSRGLAHKVRQTVRSPVRIQCYNRCETERKKKRKGIEKVIGI